MLFCFSFHLLKCNLTTLFALRKKVAFFILRQNQNRHISRTTYACKFELVLLDLVITLTLTWVKYRNCMSPLSYTSLMIYKACPWSAIMTSLVLISQFLHPLRGIWAKFSRAVAVSTVSAADEAEGTVLTFDLVLT